MKIKNTLEFNGGGQKHLSNGVSNLFATLIGGAYYG